MLYKNWGGGGYMPQDIPKTTHTLNLIKTVQTIRRK